MQQSFWCLVSWWFLGRDIAALFRMDRTLAFAQGPGIAASRARPAFRREWRARPPRECRHQIQPDGRMQALAHVRRNGESISCQVGEDSFSAFSGTEQSKIGEGTREQGSEQGRVVVVVMRHYNHHGICFRIDPDDRSSGRATTVPSASGNRAGRGEGRTGRQRRSLASPSSLAKRTSGRSVVSCSKDHQRRGWEHSLAKHRESGLRSYVSGETRPSRVPSGPCQTTASSVGTRFRRFSRRTSAQTGRGGSSSMSNEQRRDSPGPPPHKIVFGSSVVSDHLCSS